VYEPSAEARVKVVDVTTGQRLFPDPHGRADTPGHLVLAQMRMQNMEGASQTTLTVLRRNLADELAAEVARLFYEHSSEEIGSKLR